MIKLFDKYEYISYTLQTTTFDCYYYVIADRPLQFSCRNFVLVTAIPFKTAHDKLIFVYNKTNLYTKTTSC